MVTNADAHGIDPKRIAVGSDSSGANLAAAVALRCRDRGDFTLQFQLLVSPPLDHDYQTDSYRRFANGDRSALSVADMVWFHEAYASGPEELDLPSVSSLRAGSVARLPPTLLICAGNDPLLDEELAYARRLEEAGVPVTLRIFPGMFHGFWRMPGVLAKAREAIDYAGRHMAEVMRSEFRAKQES